MDRKDKVFEPALSLSYAKGFDIDHYLKVTESIIAMMSKVSGLPEKAVIREFSGPEGHGRCLPTEIHARVGYGAQKTVAGTGSALPPACY